MEETVEGAHCNTSGLFFGEEFDSVVQENQTMSENVMPVQVLREQLCYQGVALVEEEIRMSCDSLLSLSLTGKKPNGLNKCGTFPCSEVVQHAFYIDEEEPSLVSVQLGQYSSTTKLDDNATYERSLSMPASFKLVSSMKGNPGQNKTSSRDKLQVKWAPEVYDPPTSSMSHTVKGYNQRPKAKKDNRHKQNRGKSARQNGSAKKLMTERTGSQETNAAPAMEISCFVASGKDNSKCGTCYLTESLTKMQPPMGAAS